MNNTSPILIILLSILCVFFIERLNAYLVIKKKIVSEKIFLKFGSYRLHHFVWGNVLILITSFMVIGLDLQIPRNLIALIYGIGLGLVLDEFPHWMGNTKELNRNVVIIPGGLAAILICVMVLLTLLLFGY